MQFLWVFISIMAYIAGLIILLQTTPMLFLRQFDEGLFMGIAALDIIGAIFAFGAFVVTFQLFDGNVVVRVFDFLLLVGILIVAIRLLRASFQSRYVSGMIRASCILAGSFHTFLALVALYSIVVLFVAR